jgi:hypothetical protein
VQESRPAAALDPVLRWILGVLGAGSFGAGVLAVFRTDNGTGSGVLLAFGGVVFVLALLGDRVETLEVGGSKLRLRAAAAEKFALAEESERYGDTEAAAQLRVEAQALLEAAGHIASEYRLARQLPAGLKRTRLLEGVLERARVLAAEREFDPVEVRRWLREGTDEERVTALAMMQSKAELRDFDGAVAALADPRSAFEQYHAMVLAELMVDSLDAAQRSILAEALRSVRNLRFGAGTDRWRLSERILRRLEN